MPRDNMYVVLWAFPFIKDHQFLEQDTSRSIIIVIIIMQSNTAINQEQQELYRKIELELNQSGEKERYTMHVSVLYCNTI